MVQRTFGGAIKYDILGLNHYITKNQWCDDSDKNALSTRLSPV